MICGSTPAVARGNDAGERLDAAPDRLRFAHQHRRSGAVVEAGRVRGRDRAVLVEGRAQFPHRLQRRAVTDIFVGIDRNVALTCLDDVGDDLVNEATGLLRCLRLVLRADGELILVIARKLPLARNILGGDAHVVTVESVGQAVLDHRVDHLHVAHLDAAA